MDPKPSAPTAPETRPPATPAAGPLDDPPGQRSRSQGLWVGPYTDSFPVLLEPSSCMLPTPAITAPASRSARYGPDSPGANRTPGTAAAPIVSARHGRGHLSLIRTGTPRSGPSGASSSIRRDSAGKVAT